MDTREKQMRAKIKRRKQVAKQKMMLLLVTVFIITVGSIVFGSIFSSANNPERNFKQHKYYKSIVIEDGDSLWSIAEDYCTETCDDTRAYVNELKELNGLSSETIYEGQHLLVIYYDTETH